MPQVKGFAKGTLKVINKTTKALPFGTLISEIAGLIYDIIKIYDNVECNQHICIALLERVDRAEICLRQFNRMWQENEAKFRDEGYYKSFCKFRLVLQEIQKFATDVTQFNRVKKFFRANKISERFKQLADDFDIVMKELDFTMAISNEEQRRIDQDILEKELEIIKKVRAND